MPRKRHSEERIIYALKQTAPGNLGWRGGLATGYSLLSDALAEMGDAPGSLRNAINALEIRRRLYDDPSGRLDVENTRNLALLLTKTAVGLMNDGATLARELGSRPGALPDHPALLAGSIETHGETLVGQERQPEGLALYLEARTLRLALVSEFPSHIGFRRALAETHTSIAGLYKDRGEENLARTELESARQLRRALAQELPQSPSDVKSLADTERLLRELSGSKIQP